MKKLKVYLCKFIVVLICILSYEISIKKIQLDNNHEIVFINDENIKIWDNFLDVKNKTYFFQNVDINYLNDENIFEYLCNGGLIIVNNNNQQEDKLQKLSVDSSVNKSFKEESNKGEYFFFNGQNIVKVNYMVGYAVKEEEKNAGKYIKRQEINENQIIQEIIDNLESVKVLSLGPNPELDTNPGDGGNPSIPNTTGEIIATGFYQTILYINNTTDVCCSYIISSNVVDIAKIEDTNGIIHGIYDINTAFTVDAEPGYSVREYSVRMRSPHDIIDFAYINSDTVNTVSLSAGVGFQGTILQGTIEEAYSYSFNTNSQEIINDLPAGSLKYWHSQIVLPTDNASYMLRPAIRVANNNDTSITRAFSRIETFKIQKIEQDGSISVYVLMDEFRVELGIEWYYNGFIRQTESIG